MKRILSIVALLAFSCVPSTPAVPRAVMYSTELAACTELSNTCQESLACENRVRARYGRPLRNAALGCQ